EAIRRHHVAQQRLPHHDNCALTSADNLSRIEKGLIDGQQERGEIAAARRLEHRPIESTFDMYDVGTIVALSPRQCVVRSNDNHQSAGDDGVGERKDDRRGDCLQPATADPAEKKLGVNHLNSCMRSPGGPRKAQKRTGTVTPREAAINSPDAVANEAIDPMNMAGRVSETIPATATPIPKMSNSRRQK